MGRLGELSWVPLLRKWAGPARGPHQQASRGASEARRRTPNLELSPGALPALRRGAPPVTRRQAARAARDAGRIRQHPSDAPPPSPDPGAAVPRDAPARPWAALPGELEARAAERLDGPPPVACACKPWAAALACPCAQGVWFAARVLRPCAAACGVPLAELAASGGVARALALALLAWRRTARVRPAALVATLAAAGPLALVGPRRQPLGETDRVGRLLARGATSMGAGDLDLPPAAARAAHAGAHATATLLVLAKSAAAGGSPWLLLGVIKCAARWMEAFDARDPGLERAWAASGGGGGEGGDKESSDQGEDEDAGGKAGNTQAAE
jgi:hypothetical protein